MPRLSGKHVIPSHFFDSYAAKHLFVPLRIVTDTAATTRRKIKTKAGRYLHTCIFAFTHLPCVDGQKSVLEI